MKLYEIKDAMAECVLVDEETGEVIGIDTERLAALDMELEEKFIGIGNWIRNLESDAAQLKAERDYFARRQQSVESRIKSLKEWVAGNLDRDIKTATMSIKRTTTRRCEAVDMESIPEAYRRYKGWEPDKSAAKKALMAGEYVPGFEIVEVPGVQIRGGA